MKARTWLVHLPRETCEELLRTAVIGRVGVIVDGRPQVFPVTHVFDGGAVLFPTNAGTKMHAALTWPSVGFEVDGIEADGSSAWSVMVQGPAEEITDPDEIRRAVALSTAAFRAGDEVRWIRIVPSEVTGRRIGSETFSA